MRGVFVQLLARVASAVYGVVDCVTVFVCWRPVMNVLGDLNLSPRRQRLEGGTEDFPVDVIECSFCPSLL